MLRTASTPQHLLLGSAVSYAVVFCALVAVGSPGLGVGQGFFLPIVLAALATDASTGAVAGVWALVLYATAQLIAGREQWHTLVSEPSSIRLAAYVAAGVAAGWFATRARGMLAESFGVLDDLLAFARRDPETGLHTRDAFEDAVAERAEASRPFALLLVETPGGGDARRIALALPAAAALAQLTGDRYALVLDTADPAAAGRAAGLVERMPGGATVGWALHPVDGSGALALVAAAGERLQARRSGQRSSSSASSE